MAFSPGDITKEHILSAVKKIEKQQIDLIPSTRWDVVINGKTYPPKEVMRYAHEAMNGEKLWKPSGGPPTNTYLERFGFEIKEKGDTLKKIIENYKNHIRENGFEDEIYKWELLNKYRGQPLLEDDIVSKILEINYDNLIFPLSGAVLKDLARENASELKQCLLYLFDEHISLQERINHYSSETLKLYRQFIPDPKLSHHQDERTISAYLTFKYPDKYSFYKNSFYKELCKLLGVKAKPKGQKYVHYLELLPNFIEEYIKTDEELLELQKVKFPPSLSIDTNHNILAQDILYQTFDKKIGQKIKYWRIGTTDDKGNSYWEYMKDNSRISIGWSETGDLNLYELSNKEEVIELFKNKGFYINDNRTCSKKAGEFFNFYNSIKYNDVILAQDGQKVLGIGTVNGEYFYEESIAFYHHLPVKWIVLNPELINKEGLRTTVYPLSDLEIINKIEKIISIQKDAKVKSNQAVMKTIPLNQILYGPPGTGKTYNTINKAVQIIDPSYYANSRKQLVDYFNKLKMEGRIEFITFHQSFSYEDFIEGIKPIMNNEEENGEVKYEIRSGIFKLLCNKARGISKVKTTIGQTNFFEASYYKMSLGGKNKPHIHDWCINNNKLSIGWGGDADISHLKQFTGDWNQFRNSFQKQYPSIVEESRYHIQALYIFLKMKKGDVVLISKGNKIIDAIGVISDNEYIYDPNQEFDYYHYRNVKWLATNLNASPELFVSKNISQQTIYEFYDSYIKKDYFNQKFNTNQEAQSIENYVLVIDEINRGNIASIFGELITLIEPDKRLGEVNELTATLPYSGKEEKPFGVPPNLYIIGTMNTADRSVEALDAALRRRFSFEEIPPLYDLKELDYEFEGFNARNILKTINRRIEKILDKDHLIGHSYFLKNEEEDAETVLQKAFFEKIIPLLQEYFYGDIGKINLILGNGFMIKENGTSDIFPDSFYEKAEYLEREIYKLIPKNEVDLKDALHKMKIISD
jgi:5-methylcytosine-specific restriction protein B